MVRVSWSGRVLTLVLDRPERRNAVDLATLGELDEALDEAVAGGPDERARVVVLAGAALTCVDEDEFAGALGRVLARLAAIDLPVIAAIDGPALGAGAQLASVC